MFDIGWTELLLVAILAVILFKPADLPDIMRKMGQSASRLKFFLFDTQKQFRDAMREADLDDVNISLNELRELRSFSPRHQIAKALQDIDVTNAQGKIKGSDDGKPGKA